MNKITRVEVIDENGRSYVNWEDDNNVSWQFQDNGKTLKIFVNKVKSKSPVEEAYKRWMGEYPPTTPSVSNYEDNRWSVFQNGYNASQEQLEREMIKRHLKTSLQELANGDVRPIYDVVRETKNQQESWMNKPVEELVAMLEKDPPDCLKFVMGKTLEQLIERWWCDVFVGPNEKWTMEECIADLCDRIFLWLPKEQSAAGSQSLGVEDLVDGFNDAIKKIKSKIHNKKVTP